MADSNANALVQEAIKAFRANDKTTARDLLLKAVDQDERNEQAWMWMSAVVDSLQEQQICLENVLDLNPNNEKAKKGLAIVKQKLGTSSPSAPPPAPSPAATPPATGSTSPLASDLDSNPFGAWDSDIITPAPNTSVDWSKPDAPAVYGSGKSVDAPSSDQYDEWIDNLGISGSPASAPPQHSNPFTDLGWDSVDSGTGAAAPAPIGNPWESDENIWAESGATSPEPKPQQNTDPWANVGIGSSIASSSDPWGAAPKETNPFEAGPPDSGGNVWGAGSSTPAFETSPAPDETSVDAWGNPVQAEDPFNSPPAQNFGSFSSPPASDSGASVFTTDSEDEIESPVFEDRDTSSRGYDFGDDTFEVSDDDFLVGEDFSSFDFGDEGPDDFDPFANEEYDFDQLETSFPSPRAAKSKPKPGVEIPPELFKGVHTRSGMIVFILLILNAVAAVALVLG